MTLHLLEARAEFLALARPSADYCRQHGVDWVATEAASGGVYMLPIRSLPGGRFEFYAESDTLAAVCEAIGPDGETIADLVGWSTTDPTRVRTLLGLAALLGENVAANPATCAFGLPLRLFRTPLGWLQSGCDGVAVLDVDRAVKRLLDLAPDAALAAEDDGHARELHEARCRLIRSQPIMVPERSAAQRFVEAA